MKYKNKETLLNYFQIVLAIFSPLLAGLLNDKLNRKNLVYRRVRI